MTARKLKIKICIQTSKGCPIKSGVLCTSGEQLSSTALGTWTGYLTSLVVGPTLGHPLHRAVADVSAEPLSLSWAPGQLHPRLLLSFKQTPEVGRQCSTKPFCAWQSWRIAVSKLANRLISVVRLLAAPRTVARQAPLSMKFSRQEYCSG